MDFYGVVTGLTDLSARYAVTGVERRGAAILPCHQTVVSTDAYGHLRMEKPTSPLISRGVN